jgi:isoleucyl-tRNA synthetase
MSGNKSISDHEKEILAFWQENNTFEKSLEQTKKGKPYVFYDGPPFATGLPHHGHLLGSTLKDVFPRFFTMKGHYVQRVWGWDCHGLPIENIVEKDLKLSGKDEIEKIGVKKFNDSCRSQVLKFAGDWKNYIDRIGRWVDFDKGYKTMDNSYIESVWWAFKQLWEKGYLYEGEKILMYCPRCSTPLAKSEIAMDNSYKTINDISVVVKLAIKGEAHTYALAWTTTPWTLPSNLALAVNPKMIYVFVKDLSDGNTYVLAKELLEKFYKSESEYDIVKEVKGKELEGKEYEPLYDYFKDTPNAFKIILGDFVTSEDGTGIVHTAPAFGEDDNVVCRKYQIPMVQPVDEKGNFTEEVVDYKGQFVHDANLQIVKDLKSSGKAIMSRKISHEYPFCYRCDTKLMYRALPAWFVNIQKVKKKLLKLNQKINWIPDFLKDGRMNHNIETAPDWNITRNRYWATAIPIWKSEDGGIKVLGSIEELKKYAKSLPKGDVDLHKDYLDQVELEIDGKSYHRIPEVLDCWFESGSMPFAQFHYPFENKEFFEKNFPAQFVVEYIAQTRTWFYYMMAISAILFDKIPFENVLVTGTFNAEDGSKLSKSKKNFTDPMELLEKFGADTFRFYMMQSSVAMANDSNVSDRVIEEIYKKVILLSYNVNNFYELYRNLEDTPLNPKNILDKWIVSETNRLIKEVGESLGSYNTIKACSAIRNYIDGLSTWYVRRGRDRFNSGDLQAKATLKFALDSLSKVIAPIMPFIAEKIHQNLHGKNSSVHLQKWPEFNGKKIDDKISSEMSGARSIVSNALRERDRSGIGVKWPLQKFTVNVEPLPKRYIDIILDETNVKNILFEKSDEELSVVLDTNLTPELEAEGYAREITRKVQAARKDAGLVKEDGILLEISSDFNDKILAHKEMIKEKVGAKSVSFDDSSQKFDYSSKGKIKGNNFEIKFNKL